MKKRTILCCSFILAYSSFSFSQENLVTGTQNRTVKRATRTHEVTTESKKSSGNFKLSQSNDLNTIEGIDRELVTLENVLLVNKDDASFDKVMIVQQHLQ